MDAQSRDGPAPANLAGAPPAAGEIALSVVVPVYNQAGSIVHNIGVIHQRVAADASGPIEVIVVSDGSIDRTEELLLESELTDVRVLHYDRNLGKGYAVKVGALEARGRWIGYVDADLDLDPAGLAEYAAIAERDGLDFAIGSKRHPDSSVAYPRSRRVASWFFQQLVRVLFDLDVRDTQVGLKVFRREIADQVVPLLLVKRYAFDIELLAVSRAFGFSRVRELPIVLEYQFAGSGVRSSAVLYALVDVLAVFYRLRVLRYYQRRRTIGGAYAWTRPSGSHTAVAVVSSEADATARLDYEPLERILLTHDDIEARRAAAATSDASVIAFLEPGARLSGNWVSATAPFFRRPDIDAVVTPRLSPAKTSRRGRAAAAIAESRIGGGSLHFRFTPGNIRFVSDFPARSYLVRRARYLELDGGTPDEEVVLALADRGGKVIYLPEASVTALQPPLFRPQLRAIAAYGRTRGAAVRRRGIAAIRPSTLAALALFVYGTAGWALPVAGYTSFDLWVAAWAAYAAIALTAAALGGLRHRSFVVGLLTAVGLVLTHVVYALAFVRGALRSNARAGYPR